MGALVAKKHTYRYSRLGMYDAYGGPEKPDYSDKEHAATPTRAGRFVVGSIGPHVTRRTGKGTYMFSTVAWGTPLKLDAQKAVIIKPNNGPWIRLSSLPAWKLHYPDTVDGQRQLREELELAYNELWNSFKPYRSPRHNGSLPSSWVFSDFGHTTVKYFQDLNRNGRMDGRETPMSDFIHTTPDAELMTRLSAERADFPFAVTLGPSHGCVHTRPTEIDEMITRGYLRVGAAFQVHSYTSRHKIIFEDTGWDRQRGPMELHFFPGEHKLVAYSVSRTDF